MSKENRQQIERFLLSLVAVHTRNVLDLDNNIKVSIEDSELNTDSIKRRVIIDFPSIESWGQATNMWASWKNAYKYRKRKR